MADLEAVFADPDCFHSPGSRDPRPVQDYAISLASEFVGAYHDDLNPRACPSAEAEDAGSPKAARRHLTFVRHKVATRFRHLVGYPCVVTLYPSIDVGVAGRHLLERLPPLGGPERLGKQQHLGAVKVALRK